MYKNGIFVEVEEGPPGWIDLDGYMSPLYDSFETYYAEYLTFHGITG